MDRGRAYGGMRLSDMPVTKDWISWVPSPLVKNCGVSLFSLFIILYPFIVHAKGMELVKILAYGPNWSITVYEDDKKFQNLRVISGSHQIFTNRNEKFYLFSKDKIQIASEGGKAIVISSDSGGAHCCTQFFVFVENKSILSFAGELPGGDGDPSLGLLKSDASQASWIVAWDELSLYTEGRPILLKWPLVYIYRNKKLQVDQIAMRASLDDAKRNPCGLSNSIDQKIEIIVTPSLINYQERVNINENSGPTRDLTEITDDLKSSEKSRDRLGEIFQIAVCLIYSGNEPLARNAVFASSHSKKEGLRLWENILIAVSSGFYARSQNPKK
jgi:hypothetical protein